MTEPKSFESAGRIGDGRLARWAFRIGTASATAALIFAGLEASSAEAPTRIDPSAPCVSSQCHARIADRPNVHGPEFVQDCRECHAAEGDAHEFEVADAPALCEQCHEPVNRESNVHDPAEEDCLDCHDPHGSDAEGLLTEGSLEELCFGCHDEEEIRPGKFQHGPVEAGECTECHDPHSSPHPNLLVEEGSELCAQCHDDVTDAMARADSVHEPAEEDCTECHDPHSGPYPKMLPAEKRELCNECHDDVVESAVEAKVDHAPTTHGDECLNCHSPHAGEGDANLPKSQVALCLGCHDEPVKSGNGKLINMESLLKSNPYWHKAIRKEGCAACHDPHGNDHVRLLKKPFPKGLYSAFARQQYGLCFSCHEPSLVTLRSTGSKTGFRDGERNLHFLHVNKKKRGRTCRVCHEMHAGKNPMVVREQLQYGRWRMALHFQKTETGGSCAPGCHAAKTYDRLKP